MYSPQLGRFLQRDPIPDSNLYEYVDSNPLTGLDPSGLFSSPSGGTLVKTDTISSQYATGTISIYTGGTTNQWTQDPRTHTWNNRPDAGLTIYALFNSTSNCADCHMLQIATRTGTDASGKQLAGSYRRGIKDFATGRDFVVLNVYGQPHLDNPRLI